jgi:hypothetical protein
MKRSILALALLALCFACPAYAQEAAGGDHLVQLIKDNGEGNNLKRIIYRSVMADDAYKAAVARMGDFDAQDVTVQQIDAMLPAYQDQWNRNLAASFLDYFTPDEVESILKDGPASPYSYRYQVQRENISKAMDARSHDLVMQFIAEVEAKILVATPPSGNTSPSNGAQVSE